ncbi:MAG: nuclear transport factor 2 family protein [Labilithrix sp.]|nr:nuclear transport factor 2 family protein [Labilithrix sp.]
MSTLEIGRKYVELCRKNEHAQILETLFSKDAVSVEAGAPPGKSAEARGMPAIHAKGEAWGKDHEIHGITVDGPWPNGDRFIVRMELDVTNKPSGKRFKMEEAGLFTVEKGKIVREEFFYAMG